MAKITLIIEDGTCVDDANSYARVECARDYWSNRFGGEKWDLSFEGDNHCEQSICKALIGAGDYLRTLDLTKDLCGNSCVPTPINCDCDGKSSIELLKEAQIIVADAILKGWNPFVRSRVSSPLISSISSPDEGSMSFASPVSLNVLQGCAPEEIGRDVKRRIHKLLEPIMSHKIKGRRVLS